MGAEGLSIHVCGTIPNLVAKTYNGPQLGVWEADQR